MASVTFDFYDEASYQDAYDYLLNNGVNPSIYGDFGVCGYKALSFRDIDFSKEEDNFQKRLAYQNAKALISKCGKKREEKEY